MMRVTNSHSHSHSHKQRIAEDKTKYCECSTCTIVGKVKLEDEYDPLFFNRKGAFLK